jgi:hypothetical protein
MRLTIKNLKTDRIINLGTINGHMLCLDRGKEKQLTEDESRLFENQIVNYAEGGFISVKKEVERATPEVKQKAVKPVKHKTSVIDKVKTMIE